MAESVKITLSLDNPEGQIMPFPRRELVLGPENKSIVIGRASKAETKGLVSLPNNAWFLSPVMSRQHAEIVAHLKEKKVTVKDLGSLHGTYVNGSKDKLEKDELRELQDGDKLQLGLSIFRGADAFPPTTLDVNIEYREKRTHSPTTTFQVPDCSDVEEDYSSDSLSDIQELTQLPPLTPTLPIPRIGSTAFNAIDLTQLPARAIHHSQIIDLSSPPHSPLSIDDNDDLNSIVELSDIGSPLPNRSSSPNNSSRVASPDLSTTSPNTNVTSPEITARKDGSSLVTSLTGLRYDNDSNSGYESSYRGSVYDDTDGDEEMDDDGFLFGENESSDGEVSDQDSLDEAAISSPRPLNMDDERILRIDSEEEDDSEDLHEDPDFDDYSSEDEASDYGTFPEAPEEELERVLASISQRPNNNITLKDSQTITNESREGLHAAQRPPSGPSVLLAYPTVPEFCVAPSDSVPNGLRSTGPVAINTLLNAEKTPQHKEVTTTEAEAVIQPTAMFTAREPSPSDAVMPKSLHPSQTEKPGNGTQPLAERLNEYFAARQQNKILAAKIQRTPEPRSSVYSLCNGVSHGCGPFSLDTVSTMGQFLKYTEDPEPEHLLQLPDVNWTEPVPEPTESRETAPTEELSADAAKLSQPSSEIDSTIKDTDDQSLRRTHVGILDIVETYQPAPAQAAKPKQEVKDVRGKRKADDISDSTSGEEKWAQGADPKKVNLEREKIVAPQSPRMSPTAQGSTTNSPAPRTVVSQEVDVRPTKKLRLFAEKLGYAALGGVTAGAMIFGTLVYTAPTFV